MRKIEFRAWNGKTIIGDNRLRANSVFVLSDELDSKDFLLLPLRYELMQYVGLKDRNGTKIFEGDIVVWTETKYNKNHPIVETFKGFVEWSDDNTIYYLVNNKTKAEFHSIQNIDIEVIGNIHESPELLNKE
jgi:uncharacterized phage protein (TIGR01671 family)